MCSGLQVSDDLPDLIFTEMHTPGRHNRALRKVRFDRFAMLNPPVEISRVDLPVMCVGKIRGWWVKESCSTGPTLTWLAMAGRTFTHEQVLSGLQLHSILHQELRHLPRRIINVVLSATEEH